MAKIAQPKQPAASATPETEVPAVDYSALILQLTEQQTAVVKAEGVANEGNIECALMAREFIADNANAERSEIRTAIATSIAVARGLKPSEIEKAPDKTLKSGTASQQEKFTRLNSAYTLVSSLLTVAWPTDEAAAKKVAKAIADGEKGFVKLKRLASKPHAKRDSDSSAKRFTLENFPEKFSLFLSTVATDLGETIEETYTRAEDVLAVLRKAPKS